MIQPKFCLILVVTLSSVVACKSRQQQSKLDIANASPLKDMIDSKLRTSIKKNVLEIYVYQRGITCSGVLVAPSLALTAGHCFGKGERFSGLAVRARTGDGLEAEGFVLDVLQATTERKNDLAIVSLNRSFVNRGWPIHDRAMPLGEGFEGYIAGRGLVSEDENISSDGTRVLYKAASFMGIPGARIQMDSKTKGTICAGDSGGPAFVIDDGHPVLVGIHSTSRGDCALRSLGWSTDVGEYRSWFKALTQNVTFVRAHLVKSDVNFEKFQDSVQKITGGQLGNDDNSVVKSHDKDIEILGGRLRSQSQSADPGSASTP